MEASRRPKQIPDPGHSFWSLCWSSERIAQPKNPPIFGGLGKSRPKNWTLGKNAWSWTLWASKSKSRRRRSYKPLVERCREKEDLISSWFSQCTGSLKQRKPPLVALQLLHARSPESLNLSYLMCLSLIRVEPRQYQAPSWRRKSSSWKDISGLAWTWRKAA